MRCSYSTFYKYYCADAGDCDKKKNCKYGGCNKLLNLLPFPTVIERLSGTHKCPYHKSRNYTCLDCKYDSYDIDGICRCKERANTPIEDRKSYHSDEWRNDSRCAYFEKVFYADD